MSILANEVRAQKVWFDENNIWILFTDGRQLSIPLVYFPRLYKATPAQRENFEMSGGGYGLHWEELDEDLNVPNLMIGHSIKKAV